MIEYDAIIFVSTDSMWDTLKDVNKRVLRVTNGKVIKALGPYRLRTEAAYHGYNVRIVEFFDEFSDEKFDKILDALVTEKTKFIGISVPISESYPIDFFFDNKNKFKNLKKRNLKICLGGQGIKKKYFYTNSLNVKDFESLICDIDFVIGGFAEKAFINVLDFLSGKTKTNLGEPYSEFKNTYYLHGTSLGFDTHNLRTVWLPEDIIEPWHALPIEISRGCIFKCSFCSFELNGKKKFDYFRREEELYSEFMHNYENFGVTRYVFSDDTYNDSREKIDMMSRVIKKLPFKIEFSAFIKPEMLLAYPEHQKILIDQGLISQSVGFESFYPETRKSFKKGKQVDEMLKAIKNMWEYGNSKGVSLKTHFLMIIGGPHETKESVINGYEFAKKQKYISAISYVPLRIYNIENNTDHAFVDDISKDPESFGYKIYEKNMYSVKWDNGHMNVDDAYLLHIKYEKDLRTWMHPLAALGTTQTLPTVLTEKSFNQLYNNPDSTIDDLLFEYHVNPNKEILLNFRDKIYQAIIDGVRTPINIERYVESQPIKFA